MIFVEKEKLLIFHDFYTKELVFVHHNIVTFRQSGVMCSMSYGKALQLSIESETLFALASKSELWIMNSIDKDGYKSIHKISKKQGNHKSPYPISPYTQIFK